MPWKLMLIIEGDGDPARAQIVEADIGFVVGGRGGRIISTDYNDHGATIHDDHTRNLSSDDAAIAAINYRARHTADDSARAHTPGFGNF